MEVVNDNRCSWINDLNPRTNIQTLLSDLSCEWFNVIRNTVTDEILATYRPDEDVKKIIADLGIDKKDIKVSGVLKKLKKKSS